MAEALEQKFLSVLEKDRSQFISKWMIAWDYQQIRKKRGLKYDENLPEDFFSFNGPQDMTKWMNWFANDYPDYFSESLTAELVKLSLENDKKILSRLNLPYDFQNYDKRVGINNAHDFLFSNFYPVPERNKIKNVIDFGAGYGRQANLFTSKIPDAIYTAIDAIPNSYCLQNLYFSNFDKPFYEYIDNPEKFKIENSKKGIYHLPTWRKDLLPDNFYDLAMCVQVLPELNSTLVSTMLKEFQRTLKPGGMLYIRDHSSTWKPAGKINVDEFLSDNGFVLEFKPHIVNDKDLHGIPRIWRKIDPDVVKSQTMTFDKKLKQTIEDIDTLSGGLLRKVVKKVKAPKG